MDEVQEEKSLLSSQSSEDEQQRSKFVSKINPKNFEITTTLSDAITDNKKQLNLHTLHLWEARHHQTARVTQLAYNFPHIIAKICEILPDALDRPVHEWEWAIQTIEQSLQNNPNIRKTNPHYNFSHLFDSHYFENIDNEIIELEHKSQIICRHIVTSENLGMLMMYYYNPKSKINNLPTLYVAFKGTMTLRDWKHNFNMSATPLREIFRSQGSAHSGYVDLYKNIATHIENIFDIKWPIKPMRIIFTGHSAGAALSTLAGFHTAIRKIQLRQNDVAIHIISFLGPPIFDEEARKVFNILLGNRTLMYDRIINGSDDPVPKIPIWLNHVGISSEPDAIEWFQKIDNIYYYYSQHQQQQYRRKQDKLGNNLNLKYRELFIPMTDLKTSESRQKFLETRKKSLHLVSAIRKIFLPSDQQIIDQINIGNIAARFLPNKIEYSCEQGAHCHVFYVGIRPRVLFKGYEFLSDKFTEMRSRSKNNNKVREYNLKTTIYKNVKTNQYFAIPLLESATTREKKYGIANVNQNIVVERIGRPIENKIYQLYKKLIPRRFRMISRKKSRVGEEREKLFGGRNSGRNKTKKQHRI